MLNRLYIIARKGDPTRGRYRFMVRVSAGSARESKGPLPFGRVVWGVRGVSHQKQQFPFPIGRGGQGIGFTPTTLSNSRRYGKGKAAWKGVTA